MSVQPTRNYRAMALTVQELIDMLNGVADKNLPVLIEGCDCAEWAGDVKLTHDSEYYVEIIRVDHLDR